MNTHTSVTDAEVEAALDTYFTVREPGVTARKTFRLILEQFAQSRQPSSEAEQQRDERADVLYPLPKRSSCDAPDLHLFEFWWAEYMPEATQARAWEAWQAAPRADGVGVETSSGPSSEAVVWIPPEREGEYHGSDAVTAYRTEKAGWQPLCKCATAAIKAAHPQPSSEAVELPPLLEAANDILERAQCLCPHKIRYEEGKHMSGCWLFDLNLATTAAIKAAHPRAPTVPTGPALAVLTVKHDRPLETFYTEEVFRLPEGRYWLQAAHPQPAAPAGPTETEVLGKTCMDGGKCHHGCEACCFRRKFCAPLSASGLTMEQWQYSAAPVGGQGEVKSSHEAHLREVLSVVQDYLPPDGIDAREALSKIISLVDPWPAATPTPSVDAEMVKDAERLAFLEKLIQDGALVSIFIVNKKARLTAEWQGVKSTSVRSEKPDVRSLLDVASAAHKGMRK